MIEPPGPALPEEADALFELLSAQLLEHAIPLAPRLLAEAIAGALADDGRALILVAREEDRPVGVAYLSFQWTLERGGNVLWVEELYVTPERRNQGIGALDLGLQLAALALRRVVRAIEVERRGVRVYKALDDKAKAAALPPDDAFASGRPCPLVNVLDVNPDEAAADVCDARRA